MKLTDAEIVLFQRLPGPPEKCAIKKPTIIWIIEWLPLSEQKRTGLELYEWLKERQILSPIYHRCTNKVDVLSSIEQATNYVQETGVIPVLHIEAHGDKKGLKGPGAGGGSDYLFWKELADPLQKINFKTRGNLLLIIAACTGFAAITSCFKGPFAPFAAMVGPASEIAPFSLLHATKELYRRLADKKANFSEMAENASKEAGTVTFEPESFALLAFESFAESLIYSQRPEQQKLQFERVRQRLEQETLLSVEEIDWRMAVMSPRPLALRKQEQQNMWDKMFMIDIFPENRMKFGVDWSVLIDIIERSSIGTMLDAHKDLLPAS
jgi:hypothetical protein